MNKTSFDIYISYASEDKPFVRKLTVWLRTSGYKVWLDEEQLIPGARFRIGLQQGLRESQHLVAILSEAYSTRSWTQRELDLFDIAASSEERKILALKIRELPNSNLDQVFLVNQRIDWLTNDFNPAAFWLLHCGIKSKKPGPQSKWESEGQKLLRIENDSGVEVILMDKILLAPPSIEEQIRDQALDCLLSDDDKWKGKFHNLRTRLSKLSDRRFLMKFWSEGKTQEACVISLASLPNLHMPHSVWPFIDIGILDVTNWFLASSRLASEPKSSEIYFSWAISQELWSLLPMAADQVDSDTVGKHFKRLARAAINTNRSFSDFKRYYDYGVMITPWNHFHLCWLALRLGDNESAMAHAEALCKIASTGDNRAPRFIIRLSNWTIFKSLRSNPELNDQLLKLKKQFNSLSERSSLQKMWFDKVPMHLINVRIREIWVYAIKSENNV